MNAISIANITPRLVSDRRISSSFSSELKNSTDYGRTRNGEARLPSISEYFGDTNNILDLFHSPCLEDMDSILEGVGIIPATQTVLEECHKFGEICDHSPRKNIDLTELMITGRRKRLSDTKANHCDGQSFPTRTTGYHGFANCIDRYLEEELARVISDESRDPAESAAPISKSCRSFDCMKKQKRLGETNTNDSTAPFVWVLQPKIKNGKVRFKVSTDFGPCFYLKEKELAEFHDITKRLSRSDDKSVISCNPFFQVYTMDSNESRVIKSEGMASIIEEMTVATRKGKYLSVKSATGGRCSRSLEENTCTKAKHTRGYIRLVNVPSPTTTTSCPSGPNRKNRSPGMVKYFTRFLNRQRLKRLVYRQTRTVLRNKNGRSRLFTLTSSFQLRQNSCSIT